MRTSRLPTVGASVATRCQYWGGALLVGGQGQQWSLAGEVQCIIGNGHMGPPPNIMTNTTENITFPQLRWRAVTMELRACDLNDNVAPTATWSTIRRFSQKRCNNNISILVAHWAHLVKNQSPLDLLWLTTKKFKDLVITLEVACWALWPHVHNTSLDLCPFTIIFCLIIHFNTIHAHPSLVVSAAPASSFRVSGS